MTAQILDGKVLADKIKRDIQSSIQQLNQNRRPGLAVILIGQDPASELYVRNKKRACAEVGILSRSYNLDNTITEDQLLKLIVELNEDTEIDGILVQLPLPEHIDTNLILEHIDPSKDVDGFHPYNLGRLAQGRPLLRPCTPKGILLLLNSINIELNGMNATVVGASNIVGRPMMLELLMAGATVTACHRSTIDLDKHVKKAELLISATGHPHLIQADWVKKGAVVIDVGMHRMHDGHLVGDVIFEEVKEKASFITPVPGGVGPMTVASLLLNTVSAHQMHRKNFA